MKSPLENSFEALKSLFAPAECDVIWSNEDGMEISLDGDLFPLSLDESERAWMQSSSGGPLLAVQDLVNLGSGQTDNQARQRASLVACHASLS